MVANNPEGQERMTKISKLSFLIHPGFQSSEHGRVISNAQVVHSAHDTNKYDAQLDKYVAHARSLKSDEVMVAFTAQTKNDYFMTGAPYMKALREIRDILGRRLIILSAGQQIMSDGQPQGFETLKKIARARGFVFDKSITTEAFGEMLGGCVEDAANCLNTSGELRKKTKIIPELTNEDISKEKKVGSWEPVGIYKRRKKAEYKRIKY